MDIDPDTVADLVAAAEEMTDDEHIAMSLMVDATATLAVNHDFDTEDLIIRLLMKVQVLRADQEAAATRRVS